MIPVVRVMTTLMIPIMEGSGDEFSDLEDVDGYDSNDELDDVSPSEDPQIQTQLLINPSLNGPQH